jgi:hypothetical protein
MLARLRRGTVDRALIASFARIAADSNPTGRSIFSTLVDLAGGGGPAAPGDAGAVGHQPAQRGGTQSRRRCGPRGRAPEGLASVSPIPYRWCRAHRSLKQAIVALVAMSAMFAYATVLATALVGIWSADKEDARILAVLVTLGVPILGFAFLAALSARASSARSGGSA